jgi:hypothetical protein
MATNLQQIHIVTGSAFTLPLCPAATAAAAAAAAVASADVKDGW